jgi:flap endonuclease-1
LLGLMGIPFLTAPYESEAQCSVYCRNKVMFATATEDMDALACGSPIMIRGISSPLSKTGGMVKEIKLDKVLQEMGFTMDEFIDMCILLGCDYSDKIKGIGPVKAYQLIKDHRNIETILKKIDQKKHPVPEHFPYQEIREYFKNPPVLESELNTSNFQCKLPDEEGLLRFMVDEKGFEKTRILAGITKLKKFKVVNNQSKITSFFG